MPDESEQRMYESRSAPNATTSADGSAPYQEASPTEGQKQTEVNDEFFQDSVAIIGPPKAGKTALVVALPHACRVRSQGQPVMSLVGEKLSRKTIDVGSGPDHTFVVEDVARLLRGGVGKIAELDRKSAFVDATDQPYIYPVSIAIPSLKQNLRLRIVDGPGGALFPGPDETPRYFDALVRACAKAKMLVICMSCTDMDSIVLAENIDPVLQGILSYAPVRGVLPFRRVLILVTKIDSLVQQCLLHPDYSDLYPPYELARSMSPMAQVKEIVNLGVLEAVRTRLPADAQMAVGLTSAAGFNAKNDKAMIGLDGKVIRYPNSGFRESNQAMLNQWRTFGVRESLYFLAGGKPTGPIVRYTDDNSFIDELEFAAQMSPFNQGEETIYG